MIRYDTQLKLISRKEITLKCSSARAQPAISNERRYRLVNCDKKKEVINVRWKTAWPMKQRVSIIFTRVPLTLWFLLLSTICIMPAYSGRSVNYLSCDCVCTPSSISDESKRLKKKKKPKRDYAQVLAVSRILTDQLRKLKTLVCTSLIYRYFTCILCNDFNHFVWLPFMCVDQKDHAATWLLKSCMVFFRFVQWTFDNMDGCNSFISFIATAHCCVGI